MSWLAGPVAGRSGRWSRAQMAALVRSATAAITVGLTAPLGVAATPAFASGGGGGVSPSGACTNGGHFKLKAKHDDGKIEMEYEVDPNRAGQVWAVRITDNGAVVVAQHATTAGPSGSLPAGPTRGRAKSGSRMKHCRAAARSSPCRPRYPGLRRRPLAGAAA